MSRHSLPSEPRDSRRRQEPQPQPRNEPAHAFPDRRPALPSDPSDRSERHAPGREDQPRAVFLARRTFWLRESELRTMAELGRFRMVAAADLARFAYGDDRARMERDLRRIKAQGLVSERTLPVSGRNTLRVVALTKPGKRLMRTTGRVPEDQALYHGIVKPREAKHDANLYRVFHAEAARIEQSGGRPLRVVLDYEMRRVLNRKRARLGGKQADPQELERIAREYGLEVVDRKIPIPDLRIEYQTAECEMRRLDLELATRHYHPQSVAEKARAGFSLYSPREDTLRLRRMLDEHEITARIRAL